MFFWYFVRKEKTPVKFRSCIGLAVERANLSSIVNDSGERSHSQDGSPSATQNIHHKMTVSLVFIAFKIGSFSATRNIHKMADYLLLKAFITKWQSICYSKHLSQDGSPSATHNIHHKMAVPLLLKTFKRRQSLCYSNHHKMAVSLLFKICTRWQSL